MALEIAVENTGQALLELLRSMGVKYFIGVAGSDFTMIIDGFARFAVEGKTEIKPIQAPHETCAVNMAHGYYLATGKPPVVMVHSTVGTANALCGLINAAKANVPLILLAGRPPINETGNSGTRDISIHWAQEAFDQGEIVRQFVKWDYELRNFDQLETIVRRAFSIAMTEPRGPVYLTLPRDVMTEEIERDFLIRGETDLTFAASRSFPDREIVREAARIISLAKQPLIITRSFGRNQPAVAELVRLAEMFALPVVEFEMPDCVNFPGNHALHQGFDPSALVPSADVIVVIDCAMPWSPKFATASSKAQVIHIGYDPLQSRIPMWGFPVTLAITGDSAVTVKMLADELGKAAKDQVKEIQQRFNALKKNHRSPPRARDIKNDPLAAVAAHLNEFKTDQMIFVQEYDLGLKRSFIEFDSPGTYWGFSPSGGLGFGMGGALGVKLAHPEKTVVAVVGDGTYLLGAPTPCHMVSASYDLPILWVICNNRGWGALALFTMLTEKGGWWQKAGFPLVNFDVNPKYELIAESCGGWGCAVSELDKLPGALRQALSVVQKEGRQALLNVDCRLPGSV
ncbi:MAG TPA: thiamine pyrophosphate-requiring protein [Candidatus Angelobacter sp.]|jgi:acetolactate synthase-1/2/3 large subunit|nr:thiamine pyrophosphate-requiring protein [Candidatus Angelobacter sp.]